MQLIQVMRVTDLIEEEKPDKGNSSATDGKEKSIEEKTSEVNDWDERDVLLRTWISGTMTKESMYLIVGCTIAKEMWECLEEAYLQATKEKKFQLKQLLQNIKLGSKKLDDYLKEFKGIWPCSHTQTF